MYYVFAYNKSIYDSFKFTPLELMFSHKATLPVDIEFQKKLPEAENINIKKIVRMSYFLNT